MERPTKRAFEPAYHWDDIRAYVEEKHGVDLRDYKGKFRDDPDAEYCDFWHYICDGVPGNGSFFYLPERGDDWNHPDWVEEILDLIYTEFPDAEGEQVWVSW